MQLDVSHYGAVWVVGELKSVIGTRFRGAGDLDGEGRLDFVVVRSDAPSFILFEPRDEVREHRPLCGKRLDAPGGFRKILD